MTVFVKPLSGILFVFRIIVSERFEPGLTVCKIGQHAGMVSKILKSAGFERVFKLSGGMSEWQGSQLPVVKA